MDSVGEWGCGIKTVSFHALRGMTERTLCVPFDAERPDIPSTQSVEGDHGIKKEPSQRDGSTSIVWWAY